jgi:hypothetical protein
MKQAQQGGCYMSLVKTVLLSIALTLVASEMTQAQATTFNPETQQVFTAVEKIGDNKRAFFPFTASSRNYTIRVMVGPKVGRRRPYCEGSFNYGWVGRGA